MRGLCGWHRVIRQLFNTPLNALLSTALLALVLLLGAQLVAWGLLHAVWTGTPADCRAAAGGACWAFVHEKYRLILFGRYPYAEHWRPLVAMGVLVALLVASTRERLWNWRLGLLWGMGLPAVGVLMWGGVLGLGFVPTPRWGGLPLTLMLAVFGIFGAMPLALVLALGRRSTMPLIRALCVAYIELIRGVPLISVLFMASVMFPLFLPDGVEVNQLLRAQIGFVLFTAAYLAEVIRGGLQAIPKGQHEAADALGLSYWQKQRLVIVPQALERVIAPMVNVFIGAFKDTSLVVIVGLLDLLLATRTALADAPWRPYFMEAYLFIGLIYFVCCFAMSRYSQRFETARGS